jgi:6-phosphogluconate dehydrogenase
LRTNDPATGKPIVDVILDSAGQKGTGRWSAIEALDLGVPASAIAAAVEARGLSSARSLREAIHGTLGDAELGSIGSSSPEAIAEIEKALLAGKILAYAQGFDVMAAGSKQFGWNLPLAEIARIWRAGCIIRSRMLDRMAEAYSATPAPASLILDPDFAGQIKDSLPAARKTLGRAVAEGHPVPALTSALNYLQQLRTGRSTVDLVQAQRDIFGAHGFERIDQPGAHHGPWHSGAE